ncbi:MAG: hypothetical protein E7229_06320 [Clostridiales bacterium]|nr:hypothetical protein [Clostridiales bacterium]
MAVNNNGEVTFEIVERGGALDSKNENGWTTEVNLVAWNGGQPKIDIRSWDENHERMSRGITLTEDQANKLSQILGSRYRDRNMSAPEQENAAR